RVELQRAARLEAEARVLVVELRTALPRRRGLHELALQRLDRGLQGVHLRLQELDLGGGIVDLTGVLDGRIGSGVGLIRLGRLGLSSRSRSLRRGERRSGNGESATSEERSDKLRLHVQTLSPAFLPGRPVIVLSETGAASSPPRKLHQMLLEAREVERSETPSSLLATRANVVRRGNQAGLLEVAVRSE